RRPVVRGGFGSGSLQPDDLAWSLDVAAGRRQLADSGTVASPPGRALDLTQTRAGGKAIEVRRALQLRRAAPGAIRHESQWHQQTSKQHCVRQRLGYRRVAAAVLVER